MSFSCVDFVLENKSIYTIYRYIYRMLDRRPNLSDLSDLCDLPSFKISVFSKTKASRTREICSFLLLTCVSIIFISEISLLFSVKVRHRDLSRSLCRSAHDSVVSAVRKCTRSRSLILNCHIHFRITLSSHHVVKQNEQIRTNGYRKTLSRCTRVAGFFRNVGRRRPRLP